LFLSYGKETALSTVCEGGYGERLEKTAQLGAS